MKQKQERMKELIEILNKASVLYYQHNTTMMTDYEYDRLYDELVLLEKETNMVLANSPTINVEPEISSGLETVEHPSPMLSLSKTKEVGDLEEFLKDKDGLLSWKLDGLTIVLTYEKGKLVSGVTRGTGTKGEIVTQNVKQFKNIPLEISYKGKLVLRGEAVIKYSDFNRINELRGDGSSQYKNPRNLCSGSVRQLDSSITADRSVNCIIFALIQADDNISNSKSEQFSWLESLGFEVVDYVLVNRENIAEKVEIFKDKVKKYDIPSDGLVLTYDDQDYGISLGNTAKFPRHSIAFKWKDEVAKTHLRDVDWKVSRTGLINPVAIFEPVELEGTIVSRASLHNVSILKGLELGLNDEITVYKANMIIPQVAQNLTKSNTVVIPDRCPSCKEKTEIVNSSDVQYLYCTNDFCEAKLMKRLSQFTSRDAMDIEGISDAILSRLIDELLISDYADLYNLSQYKDTIVSFEGFGEKSYNNLIQSIENSRKVNLHNFLFALGIPEIGIARAKLICKFFGYDSERVFNASFEDLSSISGIGEVIAEKWIKTFKNPQFKESLTKLLKEIEFNVIENNSTTLIDKNFVITGSVYEFKNRDEMVEYIESHGGKVLKAISNNVNYLINNDINSTSSKNKKAKELGIEIISEADLIKLATERNEA